LKLASPQKHKGLFRRLSANDWMEEARNCPNPKMLFGEFWFEGELCILYADTNLGKSILAVQIGNSISKGEAIPGFRLEAPPQKVLYFDFELSKKQFQARYTRDYEQPYHFNDNFVRAEMQPDSTDMLEAQFENFEQYLHASLIDVIAAEQAKVLIIDNITYLRDETERASFALPLMKQLQSPKHQFGLSILTLAHTPKRDLSKIITHNDLQGSKMLINFCDSAFAVGESVTDKSIRYLKQIKVRNVEYRYHTENVCVCQIAKPYNFLQFEFLNFGAERDHLKTQSADEREELIIKVKGLHAEGRSQRQIACELGVSVGVVNKYLHAEV
jgi:hypothetical protein